MPEDEAVVTEERVGSPVEPPAGSGGPGRWSGLSRGRRALLAGAPLVAVLGIGYVGTGVLASGSLPRGTTVAGVDVGGLGRDEAVSRLRERMAQSRETVTVRAGDRTATLDPAAAGLRFDPERTVDALLGGPLAPSTVVGAVTGGGPADIDTTTDRDALRTALSAALPKLEVRARDAVVELAADRPVVKAAVTGVAVELDQAVDGVASTWLSDPDAIDLPVRRTAPTVTQEEADRAARELAGPALSAPLTVVMGDVRVRLTPEQVLPTLKLTAEAGKLDLAVDGPALKAAVLEKEPKAVVPPKDARIVLRNGKPAIEPSVEGTQINAEKLAVAARTALLGTGEARTVVSPTVTKRPKLTTAQAQALGVKERVSTFSTRYPPSADRTNNLRIAARTVNGTLVLPGETFSLNEVLGRRTPEKGYRSAPVINGGRLEKDYGGGVSQVATTIFNNVFFAGLEDVKHKPHSFYISRYPEGREATVSYPTVDLAWRNDTKYAVLIQAAVTKTVDVSFWSTKVWDIKAIKGPRTNYRPTKKIYDPGPKCVPQAPSPGFDVTVTRVFSRNGKEVKRQTFSTSYIPEDHVICGPDPTKPVVPTPSPSPAPGGEVGGD